MSKWLKQSTAATIKLGPFVDDADGFTPQTGLTIAQADIRLSKEGGNMAQTNNAAGAAHDEIGYYDVPLNATDTDTLGRLKIMVNATGALPVWDEYTVLPAVVYDSLVSGTDSLLADANIVSVAGVAVALSAVVDSNVVSVGGSTATLATTVDSNIVSVDDTPTTLTATVDANVVAFASFSTSSNLTFSGSVKLTSTNNTYAGILARTTLVDTATTLTNAPSDSTGVGTLLTRLSSTRADYLDKLNVVGVVASQADINALNQSASRRITLATVSQYGIPPSGTNTYTIEARTYDGDGAPVNADSTPTLTATGSVSGSLAANLSAATNPSTGVYRWTYSVEDDATVEQIQFDISATISAVVFTLSAYTQVVSSIATTWTETDAARLSAIYDKLPSKPYLTGTSQSQGNVEASAFIGNMTGTVGGLTGVSFPLNFASLAISGAGLMSVDVRAVDGLGTNAENLADILANYDDNTNSLTLDLAGKVLGSGAGTIVAAGVSATLSTSERGAIATAVNTTLTTAHGAGSWQEGTGGGGGGTGTGTGDVAVDHNYGGTDALRVTLLDGTPVDNAIIRAYVASDYITGPLDPSPPTTLTGSDGRFVAPLMLDPDTYTVVVYNPDTKLSKNFALVVS